MFELLSIFLFKGDPILKAMTLYDKWRKIYQEDSESLSSKARKLWRGQFLPYNKTKSVKIKPPRKQHFPAANKTLSTLLV